MGRLIDKCNGCKYHIPKGGSISFDLVAGNLYGLCNDTPMLEPIQDAVRRCDYDKGEPTHETD